MEKRQKQRYSINTLKHGIPFPLFLTLLTLLEWWSRDSSWVFVYGVLSRTPAIRIVRSVNTVSSCTCWGTWDCTKCSLYEPSAFSPWSTSQKFPFKWSKSYNPCCALSHLSSNLPHRCLSNVAGVLWLPAKCSLNPMHDCGEVGKAGAARDYIFWCFSLPSCSLQSYYCLASLSLVEHFSAIGGMSIIWKGYMPCASSHSSCSCPAHIPHRPCFDLSVLASLLAKLHSCLSYVWATLVFCFSGIVLVFMMCMLADGFVHWLGCYRTDC